MINSKSLLHSDRSLSRDNPKWVAYLTATKLRSLVTGTLGYMTMLTEGDFGKLTTEQRQILLSQIKESKKQIKLIVNLIELTRPLEDGKESLKKRAQGKAKILHFEDNTFLRQLFEEYFELNGFDYSGYSSPTTNPTKIVLREKPQIILMDGLMPVLDGLAATKILKANKATRDIPIIGLDNLSGDYEKKAKNAGMIDYLSKSNLTPSEIVKRIRKILGTQSSAVPQQKKVHDKPERKINITEAIESITGLRNVTTQEGLNTVIKKLEALKDRSPIIRPDNDDDNRMPGIMQALERPDEID